MSGSFSRSTYRAQALTISETYVRSLFDQIIPLRTVYSYRDTSDAGESADAFVSVDRGGVSGAAQFYQARAYGGSRKGPPLRSIPACPPWNVVPAYSICMVAERG